MLEFKDTIELMCSDNYKDRFKAEFFQLVIRIRKLEKFYENYDNLNFKPNCTKHAYHCQLQAMSQYAGILYTRALIEDVDLTDIQLDDDEKRALTPPDWLLEACDNIDYIIGLSKTEIEYLFHSCGYNLNPEWFDDKGGYRNHFCNSVANEDDPTIKSLVKRGLMRLAETDNNLLFYVVTPRGQRVTRKLWEDKKAEKKPASISERRVEAYRRNKDYFENFRSFLDYLKRTDEEAIAFKKKWDIEEEA